jgi:hypothetical protein
VKVETQNYFSTGLRLVTQLLKTAAILVGAVTAPTTSRLFAGLFARLVARLVAGPVARLVARPIPGLGAGSPAISRTRSIATAPRTGAGAATSPTTASSATAAAAAVIAVGTVVASVLNAQLATVVLASVQTVDGVLGIVPDAKFKF